MRKATPQPVEPKPSPIAGLINPGDMLSDFLITTGNEKIFTM
jgi:hypothetical protein